MKNLAIIIGNGKTFLGGFLLILAGLLNTLGILPPGLHLDISNSQALATGMIAIGLGAKLQKIIELLAKS